MKNDYLDYMRATEEYKSSDSLMHYRTKGSKNGVSTTPGYKAIGQKALGVLNSAGQYIYSTAKTIGDRLSGVKNDYDLTKKRIINATMNGEQPSKNAVKVGNNVLSFNTIYKGKHVLPEVADKMKEVDAHEQRRASYNNANVNKSIQNINTEKARVAAAKQKEADERHASAMKKSLALAKSHDAELSPAQQKEAARIQDERHASAMKKSLALAKEKEAGDEADYQKKAEPARKQEDMNSFVAKFNGQTAQREANRDAYREAVKNAGPDLVDKAVAVLDLAVKEDPNLESKADKLLEKACKKYGVDESDLGDENDVYGKILARALANCTSVSDVISALEKTYDKTAKDAALKKKTSTQTKKTVDNEYERESEYNSRKNKYYGT